MGIYKIPKVIGINRKPSFGGRINWHHPLSQGLVGAWLFNEGGGVNAFNSVDQYPGVLNNVNQSWNPDSLNFGAGGGQVTNSINPFNFDGNSPFTCVIELFTTDIAANQSFVENISNSSPYPGWAFRILGNNIYIYMINDYGAGNYIFVTNAVGAGVLANNIWAQLAVSYSGGMSANNIKIYKNTADLGLAIGTDALSLSAASGLPLQIGKNAYNFIGSFKYVYIWNRCLPVEQIASIYANPYQMFWNPMKDIYIIPEAAPPPTGGRSIFGYDSIFHAGGIIQT